MGNKIVEWLAESNRWKHAVGGLLIGFFSGSWFTAAYTGVGIAGALELKDDLWGGEWDWIDYWLTVAGCFIGRAAGCFIGLNYTW